jgi:polyhydroxyalkanoate synthesis repressor PhaR
MLYSRWAMAYVIKRYSNRKLYDVQESRYVTLEDLKEMIRGGKEITVVDATTGDNLTAITLTQIILENERNRRAVLPTAFLHQLIRHGEGWQDFVQTALRSSMEGFITSQREADRILHEWAAMAGLIPEAEPTVRKENAQSAPPETVTPPDAEALRSEMETLKAKLRELEQRLQRKKGG